MAVNPLLAKGFETGWIQKFFLEPFDPLCVMLAMRTKLLLDVIDEMGHSYNLLRMIGYGWIDFGEVPGEEPGDPGSYYPPQLDNPIIITPAPGVPGPGQPGYVPPGPGQPGYIPPAPGPGQPGYVPPGPGQPGYIPPAPGPGEPGYAPPPPAPAAPWPGYGGGRSGGPTGGMSAPWGFLDQGLWTGRPGYAGGVGGVLNCCLDKDDIYSYVHIGYVTLEMNCGDIQGLTVVGYNEVCESAIYTWTYEPASGTLVDTGAYLANYTAPAAGVDCVTPVTIRLYCNDMLVDQITIAINPPTPATAIGYTTQQMTVNEQQTLAASGETPGCGPLVYDWAITSGGGTLSLAQGASTVYTAPATNAECANNPTITLKHNGVLLDTLKLAVNQYAANETAYKINYECKEPCQPAISQTICAYNCGTYANMYCYSCGFNAYNCWDGFRFVQMMFSTTNQSLAACPGYWNTYCNKPLEKVDLRSVGQKTGGCCPATLLL